MHHLTTVQPVDAECYDCGHDHEPKGERWCHEMECLPGCHGCEFESWQAMPEGPADE